MSGVIVEGPDGSGKTTLIKAIRNRFYWPVVHVVQPGKPDIKQMLRLLECSPVVFDRFHWSPVAYGVALREGSELSPYDLWALEGLLMNKGYVTVLCLSDMGTMLANNKKEEQLFSEVREEKAMWKIVNQYSLLLLTCELPYFVYDYRTDTLSNTLGFVDGNCLPEGPRGVLGNIRPKIWFVGDERADKGTKGISIPFYDVDIFDKLVSGTLFYRALQANDYTWQRGVALSNSAGEDLQKVYSELGEPRKVVALGAVAGTRLLEIGIEHTTVSHPQWWRRFRYHDPDGYAEKIKEAVEK